MPCDETVRCHVHTDQLVQLYLLGDDQKVHFLLKIGCLTNFPMNLFHLKAALTHQLHEGRIMNTASYWLQYS